MSDNELKNKSIDHLEHILEELEAQSRFTEIQIKEVKEELERKKKVLPLGVPIEGPLNDMPFDAISKCFVQWFPCETSADKFVEYFANFVKALQNIAEGKPVDIQLLLPLMNKGWVAMDKDGDWFWYNKKPDQGSEEWEAESFINADLRAFNIKQVKNWKSSLKESGL